MATKKSATAESAPKPMAQAMPAKIKIEKDGPDEILSRWWESDMRQWRMALDLLLPTMTQEVLDKTLRSIGMVCNYRENHSGSLRMAEELISRGANPFAKSSAEEDRYSAHAESFFAKLVSSGYWAYATDIASRQEDKALCLESIATAGPKDWSGNRKSLDGGHGLLATGGAAGFRLGFLLGLGPNDLAPTAPWFFQCKKADELAECIKAGADLSLKISDQWSAGDQKTFEECLCSNSIYYEIAESERAAMLSLIRAQGTSMDPEAGRRALVGLVARGSSWGEVQKAEKAYGLSATKVLSSESESMLEISLANGNWMLAHSLVEAGADPQALSDKSGLPMIASAVWAYPISQATWGQRSEGKVAQRKRDQSTKAVLEMFDFEWRSPSGLRLLEAARFWVESAGASASLNKARVSTTSANEMIKRSPIDSEAPLWRRLLDADARDESILAAAMTRDEPWMCPDGAGLLSMLVCAKAKAISRSSRTTGFEDSVERLLKDLQMMEDQELASKRTQELFAPSQWKSAWEACRESFAEAPQSEREALVSSMMVALRGWLGFADLAELPKSEWFDFQLMGALVSGAWASGNAINFTEFAFEAAMAICKACPEQGGVVMLDILALQSRSAMECAMRGWNRVEAHVGEVAIPEGHKLFQDPGAVGEELCNHPFWRMLEERLVAKATEPLRGPRM